jgi:hypothetical protein
VGECVLYGLQEKTRIKGEFGAKEMCLPHNETPAWSAWMNADGMIVRHDGKIICKFGEDFFWVCGEQVSGLAVLAKLARQPSQMERRCYCESDFHGETKMTKLKILLTGGISVVIQFGLAIAGWGG